jgi:hypothetical protein
MRRPADGTIVLTLGAALAVLLGPLALRGDRAESARMAENRRQIAEMTESERARLERNYDRWLKQMSAAERQQWRQFNEQLELDRQRNQGRLAAAMNDYYRWLQSVPGYRRQQLRDAATVDEKMSLVEEIVGDQVAKRLNSPEVETRTLPQGFSVTVLGPEALGRVMAALEQALLPADRNELEGLEGLQRHLKTIHSLREQYSGGLPQLATNPRVMAAIREAMPDEAIRSDGPEPLARLQVISTLYFSLQEELERQERQLDPSDAELQRFFEEELPPEKQEALYNLAANEFVREVRRRYVESRLAEGLDFDVGEAVEFLNPRPILMQMRSRNERDGMERDGGGFRPIRPDRGFFRPRDGDRPFPPRSEPDEERPPRPGDRAPSEGDRDRDESPRPEERPRRDDF